MNPKRIALIVIALLLLAGAWLGYRTLAPRVAAFSPEDGAADLPTTAEIEIEFTQEMQAETVLERLAIEPRTEGEFTWEGETLRFVPAEGWEEGAVVRVTLAEGAKSALGLAIGREESWAFTIGRTLLIYLWPADGSADLYALDPVSGETRRWTESGGVQDFSVDAARGFVYFSLRGVEGNGLSVLDRRSGEVRLVLDCGEDFCAGVQASPDGERLAFERTTPAGDVGILVLSLAENWAEQVSAAGHEVRGPQWAPDGLLAFYDADEEAYILWDVNDGEVGRLENRTGELGSWSPTGLRFVVRELFAVTTDIPRGPTGEASNQPVDEEELEPVVVATSHLMSYNTNSGEILNLSRSTDVEDASPVFSPDGRWLAFARGYLDKDTWTPGRQVWLMRSDGSEARQLSDDSDYNYSAFAWHLEEPWLVAVRSNTTLLTEPPELWLIDVDSGEMLRLVIGGYAPVWIP